MTTLDDHAVRAFVVASTIALGRLTPWVNRHATFTSTAFTTTVRVITRVHGNTTNCRANTAPAISTSLADLAQVILFITHFTNGCATFNMNATHLAGSPPP